jgi:hypothetical protein
MWCDKFNSTFNVLVCETQRKVNMYGCVSEWVGSVCVCVLTQCVCVLCVHLLWWSSCTVPVHPSQSCSLSAATLHVTYWCNVPSCLSIFLSLSFETHCCQTTATKNSGVQDSGHADLCCSVLSRCLHVHHLYNHVSVHIQFLASQSATITYTQLHLTYVQVSLSKTLQRSYLGSVGRV